MADPNDVMNDRVTTPARTRNVRKIVIIAIALLIMFVIALAVASMSIGVLQRPGADPGSADASQAPAD
ncbi:hypothetical protein [Novosphingobium sp. AP12]|uniref:hypothetical protein n=1 Tax=Novosphingobium sp. AP12 TaxID=1144305 RepID=UPI000271E6E9|nr:hypothetical protein [Novosphingobium sp. AP12]EJL34464.1 hypothetical protein PMI02_00610 [Novosphingobium sp. AP12]